MAYVSFGKSSDKATALGSSANVDKVYFPTDDNSIIMGKKIYGKSTWFGTCSTPATTAAKVVDCENFVLTLGCIIGIRFTLTSNVANCTLNVNNTGAKLVYYNNAVFTSNSNIVFGAANRTYYYMYDGTYWVWLTLGTLDGNTYTSAHCTTVATTAAKYAGCNNYVIKDPSYVHVLMGVQNTAASALTLNINSLGAKPIYINGLPSSATNYELPRGTYLVRYENGIYWFNTNDIAPIKVSKDNVKYETVTVSDKFTNRVTANGLHFSGKLAHIDKIKGNTIVWNLLVLNGNFSNGTNGWNRGSGFASMSVSDNILTAVNNPGNQYNNSIQRSANITLGHKYYVSFWFCASIEKAIYVLFANDKTEAAFTINSRTPVLCNAVVTANYNSGFLLKLANGAHTSEDWFKFKNIVLIDLTLMFGKGNEPTKEEFETLFPNPYYTYETGRLCSFDDSIKINGYGFNLWDNESISVTGKYLYVTTENTSPANSITDFIKVQPSVSYRLYCENEILGNKGSICFYDSNYNPILGYRYYNSTEFIITAPAQSKYARFTVINSYIGGYIFSVYSLNKDNTFSPYWTNTKSIDIKSLTSNGEVIFPEGLLSAGEVYDEIVGNKAIKRVGMVDLGSLSWTQRSDIESGCFDANLADRKIATDQKFNAVCKKYVTVEGTLSAGANINYYISSGAIKDLLMAGYYNSSQSDSANHTIYIVDTQFGTSAASLLSSLQGLILYYELTTPIEYTIDLNINYYFKAEALGYELLSKIDRPIPASSPASMDITYGVNEEEYTNDLIYNTINTNNSSLTSLLKLNVRLNIGIDYTFNVDEEGNPYFKKDDNYYPVSHPDISTLPSLLSLRFGVYNMYEVASRVDYSMTDNVGKANILNFHLVDSMPYADINSPYSYSGVELHLSLDRPSTKPLVYDLKCVNSNSSGNKFKKIQNVYYLTDNKKLYFDILTNNGDLEYMLLYDVDNDDGVAHSNDIPVLIIIDNFLVFSFSTNDGIISLVSFVPLLDVPSKAIVTSAVAISEAKCEPIKVIKYNSQWCIGLPLDFRPDYILCLYYIEGDNYYYNSPQESLFYLKYVAINDKQYVANNAGEVVYVTIGDGSSKYVIRRVTLPGYEHLNDITKEPSLTPMMTEPLTSFSGAPQTFLYKNYTFDWNGSAYIINPTPTT